MHQIWVVANKNNQIRHCWEAENPVNDSSPNNPPINPGFLPAGWKIMKVNPPQLLEKFQDEAKQKKKTLAQYILEEFEIDESSKPKRPDKLDSKIDYKEIRKKSEKG